MGMAKIAPSDVGETEHEQATGTLREYLLREIDGRQELVGAFRLATLPRYGKGPQRSGRRGRNRITLRRMRWRPPARYLHPPVRLQSLSEHRPADTACFAQSGTPRCPRIRITQFEVGHSCRCGVPARRPTARPRQDSMNLSNRLWDTSRRQARCNPGLAAVQLRHPSTNLA